MSISMYSFQYSRFASWHTVARLAQHGWFCVTLLLVTLVKQDGVGGVPEHISDVMQSSYLL